MAYPEHMDAPRELTDAEVEALAAALRAIEAELRETLDHSADAARPVELDQQAAGRVSRIDAIQQQQMIAAGRRRAETRLALVRQALKAVESGDYGICRKCDEPIGVRRLRARPESPICLQCQAAIERR